MKICYVDESGLHEEAPVATMAGLLVDVKRLRPTLAEFENAFNDVAISAGRSLDELKASALYTGKKPFKDMDGPDRSAVFDQLIEWFTSRKHSLLLTAVDKAAFHEVEAPSGAPMELWPAMALHIALQVQRSQSKVQADKGQTLLVFDENLRQGATFTDLLLDPPRWTDQYYGYAGRGDRLDRIPHTPLYVDSRRFGPVQLADLFSFVYRKYVESHELGEAYSGEAEKLGTWKTKLDARLIDRAHRWPAHPKNHAAEWYCDLAPKKLTSRR